MDTDTKDPTFRSMVDRVAGSVDEVLLRIVDSLGEPPSEHLIDQCLMTLGECRGHIVRAQLLASVADRALSINGHARVPTPVALPPLTPQTENKRSKPGIRAKLKTPRDYACPTCEAAVGELCRKFTIQGRHGVVIPDQYKAVGNYHHKRNDLSKSANARVRAAYNS